jgi:molybdopterin converting factor small subunit
MSIKIDVSLLSNQYTKGQQIVDVSGNTVGQCLDDLVKQYPSIRPGLFDSSGKLHSYIVIYVNGESAYPEVLAKPVKTGDKLHIIFLIGGG